MKKDGSIELCMQRLTDAQRDIHQYIAAALAVYPCDVDDVVQDTNYAIIARAEEYQPERPFLPWAILFARNQILAYLKKKKREKLVFDDELLNLYEKSVFAADSEPMSLSQQMSYLPACLEKLPERQRQLVNRHYLHGHTLVQIAREERKPESTLQMALFRARKALADCITRLCKIENEPGKEEAPSAFDILLARFVASREPSLAEDLFGQLRGNFLGMRAYAEQMDVDYLLQEWAGTLNARQSIGLRFGRRRGWRQFVASRLGKGIIAAACLVLLFAVAKSLMLRRNVRAVMPVAALQEAPAAASIPRVEPVVARQEAPAADSVSNAVPIVPPCKKTAAVAPVVVASEKTVPMKGAEMQKKRIAIAATAAAIAVTAVPAVKAAGASVSATSSATFLDTRLPAAVTSEKTFLDARFPVKVLSNGRQTRKINTATPLGTVIMLI